MFIFTSIANGTLSHCKSRILYFLEELLMKKTERTILALLMAAVCLLTLFATNAFAMTEEQAVNAGYDIFTAWHRQTYSNYHYMLYDYVSPYKSTIEKDESSAAYQSLLFAWRVANFNISSEISNADKEIAYYESFIFDMFYDEDSGSFFQTLIQNANSYNKSAEKELKSLGASVEKSIASALKAVEEEYTDGIPEGGWDVDKLERAYGIISRADEVKDACKIITNVTDFLGYAKTAGELLENICKIQAVLNSAEEIKSILEDLTSRTSFLSNPSMHTALVELQGYLENAFTQADFIPLIIGRTTVTEVSKELGKKAWGGVLECLFGAYGKAVQAGQSAGKFLADGLFNSSDSVAAYYKLRAAYFFEEELKSYIKSIESAALSNKETAKKFNTAVTMLYKAYISGMDIYQSYVEKTYREGLLNKIFPGVKDKAYEKLCDDLASIKRTIKSSYMVQEEIAEEVYNDFVEAYHYTPVPMQEEKEEYPETIALLEEKDYSFRNTISKDWTLNKDVVIYGDFTVTGGTLNLNGHTLTVYGDMIQTGGCVICNEGQLYIIGDYRIQTPKKNNDGEETCYDCSDGALKMTKDADKITVDGSFYTSSTQRYVGGDNAFSAGTITIGKNFYEYNNQYSSSNSNFNATGTHLVYFKGTGEHIVLFQGTSSGFAAVKADAKLIWSGYCNLTLQNDLTIKDNGITVRTIDLNGKVLTVDGNLIQNAGTIKCNGGTLHVTGDYRIQTPEKNANGEVTGYNTSDGSLQMTKATDKITVDGSFYTSSTQRYVGGDNAFSAGTITIGKNFYEYNNQYSSSNSNFNASGTHKVIIGGKGKHTVSFSGSGSHFSTLELTQGCGNYTFSPSKCWNAIVTASHADADHDGVCDVCATALPKLASITLSQTSVVYNGAVRSPSVTVKNAAGETLTKGTDYTLTIPTGRKIPDSYVYEAQGIGIYYGKVSATFTINKQALDSSRVTLSKSNFTYDGTVQKPSVTVKNVVGNAITEGSSYTLTWSADSKQPGAYTVTATGKGYYTGSVNKTYNILPGQVKNLKATTTAANQAVLSWTAVPGAEKYMIYTSSTAGGTFSSYAYCSGTTYTMNRTDAGKYYYKVRAYVTADSAKLYGPFSAAVRSTPGQVKNLKATTTAANQAVLSWSAVPGAEMYMIYTSATADGTFTAYDYISGTSYTMNRTNAGKYYYKVRAYVTADGAKLYGPYSTAVRSTPGQVKNLKATTTAANQAVLSWTAVPGAEKYMVYTSATENGTYSSYVMTASTSYTVKRSNADQLFYKVRAYVTANNIKQYGGYSAVARCVPGQVKNLKAVSTAANKVSLSWNAVPGAEMYMIYTATTANGTYSSYVMTANTSYMISRTNASKLYYKVRAYATVNGAKTYGAFSAAAQGLPGQVKNVKAVKVTANQAALTWDKVPGAEKYMVYYAASQNGTYTAYGMTASTSYIMNKTNAGAMYYKVRAFVTVDGAKQYGAFSTVVKAK